MIKTTILLTVLLPVTVQAQTLVCTSQCNNLGQCVSVCNPVQPGITHRRSYWDQQPTSTYDQRAYEFELRQLDRENRR